MLTLPSGIVWKKVLVWTLLTLHTMLAWYLGRNASGMVPKVSVPFMSSVVLPLTQHSTILFCQTRYTQVIPFFVARVVWLTAWDMESQHVNTAFITCRETDVPFAISLHKAGLHEIESVDPDTVTSKYAVDRIVCAPVSSSVNIAALTVKDSKGHPEY